MGKRKRRRVSSSLTWKATKGFFRLLFQGILKAAPLFFFASVGFGVFWGIRENLYADPGFFVEKVEILPEGALEEEKRGKLEQLFVGQNLFRVSLREAAREVEADPTIRRARVTRVFPRTLQIEIGYRRPFAQVEFRPKGPYSVAAEDAVWMNAQFQRDPNLVLVEAHERKGSPPEIGKKVSLEGFEEAVELVHAFWKHPLARSEAIEKVRLDHLGNVSLVLSRGPELRFGPEPMEKFYALASVTPLLKGPERNRIVYIDLQYQDLIVRKK